MDRVTFRLQSKGKIAIVGDLHVFKYNMARFSDKDAKPMKQNVELECSTFYGEIVILCGRKSFLAS